MAFVVCGKFSDLGGMRKHRYCVAHHLSGRYASQRKRNFRCLKLRLSV
ncbi:DUF3265 domain-containing protein [Vibrio parahaemolyticus]|nr:DUF3265 domain-containing protein [Vibrio parahaemolyticus]